MLLMPQRDWQWIYNDAYGVLSVSLGSDMEFLTPYKIKALIPDALSVTEFSVEHARFYIDFVERLGKSVNIADAIKVQLGLNATAAYFMLKPQMPKSWFFDTSAICVYSELGKVFQLRCQGVDADVMVVESNLQASLVMLLSSQLALNDNKSLKQFECIKVMNDRLHPKKITRQTAAA
ncbi:cell division protein ZapC [Shewanella psychrotolerans]|uniref:cell division protein ZapC n=1 Tax=Shewanella psychrotolerans TaxID=2864206 RepID=UPI001C660ECC|nr:cell division protein ZapC [Shewanella psychrotolerans]QYK03023.1 cell division protein ZapC [Shewanella psychrotolerans]